MLMRVAGLVVLACCTGACSRNDEAGPPPAVVPEGTYAPIGCLQEAVTLSYFGEPPLRHFSDSADTEAVRFVWLASFDPGVSVRLIRRGGAYALVSARTSLTGDAVPPPPQRDSVRIDAAAWKRLTRPLADDRFWIPQAPEPPGIARLDGSDWSVDQLAGGQCRGVEYWSPEAAGPGSNVRAFGILMFQAAGITPDEIY